MNYLTIPVEITNFGKLLNSFVWNKDGSWTRNNLQEAYTFVEHLESTFQPNNNEYLQDWIALDQEDNVVKPTSTKKSEIKININPVKGSGFDLITRKNLKMLLQKDIINITNLINASFRLRYVSKMHRLYWYLSQVHYPTKLHLKTIFH